MSVAHVCFECGRSKSFSTLRPLFLALETFQGAPAGFVHFQVEKCNLLPRCLLPCTLLPLLLLPRASSPPVPAGSPSRGGDVVVAYVFNISQASLPTTPFYSVLVTVSVFMALSTVFHSINSPDNSAFSLCSSGLISALLVLSTIYLFMKVSLSPDIILCG